jgi:hypothetical protein
MDRAQIDRSVVCSIATKPDQFPKILDWSGRIASPRIVPLPSVHPRDLSRAERIRQIAAAGFRGIKLHPYYQDFVLDDPDILSFLEVVADCGLFVVCHTGFDIAFERVRRCDPVKIKAVTQAIPSLRFIATHLGAWDDWDEVERHILGSPLLLEISYSLETLPADRARRLILAHPPECVIFGTDSPWQDQSAALRRLRDLRLGSTLEEAITAGNASRLLD